MKAKYFGLGVLTTLFFVMLIWLGTSVISNLMGAMALINSGNAGRGNYERWFQAKIRQIDQSLSKDYIGDIEKEKMYESAVKGYVNALGDPYTNYMTPEEYKIFQQDLSASYEGIGAPLERNPETNVLTVVSPYKDSPADKAGLRSGDIILKVDGEAIANMTIEETARKIRGKKGTTVVLSIQRTENKTTDVIDVPVVRDTIIIPTIEARMLEDNIGYIAIFGFDEPTTGQFRTELEKLKANNLKGLVLDLRGNPGGFLLSAQEIADEIMTTGLVVYTEDKNGNREDYKATDPSGLSVPVAVLIDKGSASASEILAGALKDHKIATIVGTTSFGKGLVQQTFGFVDGSALKVTIAKYYTPSGEYIHSKGIEPDVVVELKEGENIRKVEGNQMDTQLQKAWEIVKSAK